MTSPAGVAHVRSLIPRATREQRAGLHATPAIATRGLLSVEKFAGPVWEPACGDGAISEALRAGGHKVVSTDISNYGYGSSGRDFLTRNCPRKFRTIVTNPPFELWAAFAERALELDVEKFALVGRLGYLEGKSKRGLFDKCGLARVWSMYPRVNIAPARYEDASPAGLGGMIAFAWFVFEPWKKRQTPTINYIDLMPLISEEELVAHRAWSRAMSKKRKSK